MKEKKPDTYKTDHPTIKEITIGDRFVLNNGTIVTFVKYVKDNNIGRNVYPFIMENIYGSPSIFAKNLMYDLTIENHKFNIKHKYIPLKDKLDLI